MAPDSRVDDAESINLEGEALVRQFTDSLNSDTQLEESTMAAQNAEDLAVQGSHEMRMRSLYEDRSRDPSDGDFYAVDIARSALEKTCQRFAKETKPSKLVKFGINRKTSRMAANELMQQSIAQDFGELQQAVQKLESQWDSKHGRVYRNFHRLCNTFDSHKKVFAVFPQQNTYCAVLVGSLSLFVSAAVNHDTVAETLSQTVSDISVRAARCSKLIHIITTQPMRELLSELYSHVFQFYRDAMEWYLSSKTSKFFGSFNEKLNERFDKAAKNIDNCINEMYREGNIAGLAMLSMVNATTMETRDELIRQRQRSYDEADIAAAGRLMREMLKAIHQHQASSPSNRFHDGGPTITQVLGVEESPKTPGMISRVQARTNIPNLEKYIIGTEGHSLFSDGRLWVAADDASSKLQDWMDDSVARSNTLWISSPDSPPGMTSSAQAAAITAVVTAWQSETPIISHFCRRPRSSDISGNINVEQAGLIGLVYSLIIQLLQFTVEDDCFEIAEQDIKKLDGSPESWLMCLSIFSKLLDATSHLSFCIIYGLNNLAWSSGAEWCGAFLDALFEHQRSEPKGPRILLATSGQSRVLPDFVQTEDRYFARRVATELVRTKKGSGTIQRE